MRQLRNSKGFTLIELMIVVVIIGILAAIAIPKFSSLGQDAKKKEAETILKQVATLEQAYRAKCGVFLTGTIASTDTDTDGCSSLLDVGYEQPTAQYYNPAGITVAAGTTAGTITVSITAVADGLGTATLNADGTITHAAAAATP